MFKRIFQKRILFWGVGFLILFLINILVELIILPNFGLDNTDNNDIYFQPWWLVVGLWMLFGLKFIKTKI